MADMRSPAAGKYTLQGGQIMGNHSVVCGATEKGTLTPVICKFFVDEEAYRREVKFFDNMRSGNFVPGGQIGNRNSSRGCSYSLDTAADILGPIPVLTVIRTYRSARKVAADLICLQ